MWPLMQSSVLGKGKFILENEQKDAIQVHLYPYLLQLYGR